MTLDEAIKHCEEVADTCEFEASKYDMTDVYESHVACQVGECGAEHRCLAEWLKELKKLKEKDEPKYVLYVQDRLVKDDIIAYCPHCDESLNDYWDCGYCPCCGQALKW